MTWIGIGGPGTISDATGKRKRGYVRAIARLRRQEKRTRAREKRRQSKSIVRRDCEGDQQ